MIIQHGATLGDQMYCASLVRCAEPKGLSHCDSGFTGLQGLEKKERCRHLFRKAPIRRRWNGHTRQGLLVNNHAQ